MPPTLLCFFLVLLSFLSTSNASLERNYYYYYSPPRSNIPPPLAQYVPSVKPIAASEIYQFLVGQNAARAAVGLAPLVWDDRLAAYAQWWANQRRADCALVHSSGPYGENIFWGSGNSWSPVQAVTAWVTEKKCYNYYSNSCSYGQECGHYTQIVWKNTRRVGCAKITCYDDRGVFITCNYDPPGNYIGSKPY